MKFKVLSQYLQKLEKTDSRNEMTVVLADLFSKAKADEIDKVCYLTLGYLAPAYRSIVFNLAERMMIQVIAKAYGKKLEEVRSKYKAIGDLGEVASTFAQNQKSKIKKNNRSEDRQNLSVEGVYEEMVKVAKEEGEGSVERKIERMAKLLGKLDPLSAKFVARIPVGRLRLGFSDKTIIDALSWMEKGDKSGRKDLEKAYQVLPDVGLLAREVKKKGIEKATKDAKPALGVPIEAMLAQRLKSPTEMIKKMEKVAVEPKLDGLRVQIHFKSGKDGFVKAFTRNLNEITQMFPELNEFEKNVRAKEAIFDTEAIGVDEKTAKMANFQTTMTRRRKHEIEERAKSLPIVFYVFDIVYKDGKNLMDEEYLRRREVLAKTVSEGRLLKLTDFEVTSDPKEIERLEEEKVDEGLEGIIVKKIASRYVPGRTGWRWVKMKETEMQAGKLADTVDVVVVGYTRGRGKRAKFGMGQFLAGVVDGETIKTVTKVGTGLTDEEFTEMAKRLKKIEVKDKPKQYEVHKDLEPDFWVSPEVVVELAADEVTKSPKHTSGYALRFPRLVKFRDDKSAMKATSVSEVKKLFKLQGR